MVEPALARCRACSSWLACALAFFGASPAWAHPGQPPEPHDVWSAWSGEPLVLLGIGLSAWLYGRGAGRLWDRAGVGRGVRRWQLGCFAGGLAAVFVALISPLDAMGAALFSAHMVQHEVLMLVAAPLLVLGMPLVPMLWALPLRWRRRVGGWGKVSALRAVWGVLDRPVIAWVLHAVVLWAWHAPALYQATLRSEVAHVAQHLSFLGAALLFWWAVVYRGRGGRVAYGAGVVYVFTTALHSSALGALLTFSSAPWYPAYAPTTAAWGLTPLQDQQLAGLIMWVPGGIVYLIATLALFAAWLRSMEREAGRAATKASRSSSPSRPGSGSRASRGRSGAVPRGGPRRWS